MKIYDDAFLACAAQLASGWACGGLRKSNWQDRVIQRRTQAQLEATAAACSAGSAIRDCHLHTVCAGVDAASAAGAAAAACAAVAVAAAAVASHTQQVEMLCRPKLVNDQVLANERTNVCVLLADEREKERKKER